MCNELTCHIWVPILNHLETVPPNKPRSTLNRLAHRRPNPSKNEGQCRGLPDLVTAHAKVNVKDALPNDLIVRSRHTTPRRAALPPSTRMSPVIIAPLEMRSNTFTPSMDVTVALESSSVKPCKACIQLVSTTHTGEARVAAITASPQLLGHRPCNQSPKHVARDNASHTSVRFRQRCHPPHFDDLHHKLKDHTSRENFPSLDTCIEAQSSNKGRQELIRHVRRARCCPLREDIGRTISRPCSNTSWAMSHGVWQASYFHQSTLRGSHSCPGQVLHLRGPADDNSPQLHQQLRSGGPMRNVITWLSPTRSPSCGCNTVVACFACCNQLDPISPGESLKPCNQFASGMAPPPTLWRSICNFHPRSWSTSSGLLVASSNANFNVLRNGPLRNLGTAFITAARFSNHALGFTSSIGTDGRTNNGIAEIRQHDWDFFTRNAANGSPATVSSSLVTE